MPFLVCQKVQISSKNLAILNFASFSLSKNEALLAAVYNCYCC